MGRSTAISSPDQAIATVLLAERDAQESVQQCRDEAERVMEAARIRARTILERADARMTRAHIRCTRGIARAIDRLVVEQHAVLASRSRRLDLTDAELDAVVAALAADLTGGDAGGTPS